MSRARLPSRWARDNVFASAVKGSMNTQKEDIAEAKANVDRTQRNLEAVKRGEYGFPKRHRVQSSERQAHEAREQYWMQTQRTPTNPPETDFDS